MKNTDIMRLLYIYIYILNKIPKKKVDDMSKGGGHSRVELEGH